MLRHPTPATRIAGALALAAAACSAPQAPTAGDAGGEHPTAHSGAALGGLALPSPRPPRPSRTELAGAATATFRATFEAGRFEALPGVLRLLTAAYLENPRDPEVTLLLAHAHLWRVAERRRDPATDPQVVDHLVLAERWFEEAYRLAPEDNRIVGWLGSVRLPLGRLLEDPGLVDSGYALLVEGVRRYPEFNHFTAGYVLSGVPRDDPRYAEALDHMWRNVDRCSGVRPGQGMEGASAYALAEAADPACANTPGAPHNFEGFVLNLGDMLLKAGEVERARAIYARASEAPSFGAWPYRDVLERRLAEADDVAARFAAPSTPDEVPEIMAGSAYSCVACHARE